jgi:hypothetical protein
MLHSWHSCTSVNLTSSLAIDNEVVPSILFFVNAHVRKDRVQFTRQEGYKSTLLHRARRRNRGRWKEILLLCIWKEKDDQI